jgi:hypothetical protein
VDNDSEDTTATTGERVLDITATLADLSRHQKTKLDTFSSLVLPHFNKVSGKTSVIQHKIETSDVEAVKQCYYLVTPVIQQAINREIDKLLQGGTIEPSTSAWFSPIVMVKKPGGEYSLCLDFRKVNEVTKKDSYPLPYIDDILHKLCYAKSISTKDLKNGYWQVPLEPSSKEKTAFTIPGCGLFQFAVMPFGLHNAPAKFQRLLDTVLREEIGDKCSCYLHDIVVVNEELSDYFSV